MVFPVLGLEPLVAELSIDFSFVEFVGATFIYGGQCPSFKPAFKLGREIFLAYSIISAEGNFR